MPTISAMDPGLRYDDQDAEQAQQRARNQDFMMRNYMQAQQLAAQQSAQQAGLSAQERIAMADIADRDAGRQSQYGLQQLAGTQAQDLAKLAGGQAQDLAKLNLQPAMGALGLKNQMYQDERSDSAASRELGAFKDKYMLGALQGMAGGQTAQGGASQSPLTPEDMRDIMRGGFGLAPARNRQQELDDFVQKIILAKAPSADAADLPGIIDAARTGDMSKIPTRPIETIPLEQLQASIGSQAREFGERDAATFGSDPTEQDVQQIIRQRDQLAQAERARNRSLTPEQAVERANFQIMEQIRPNATRWGTEWIQRLQQALVGGTAPAIEAANPFVGGVLGMPASAAITRR